MTAAILIRDNTRDALQELAKKADESQKDVEVSLSDVIDGLLSLVGVTDNTAIEETILEEIIYIAKKN